MYLPSHFQDQNPAHALALIQQYPLATLICNDDEGFPFVSHVPVHVNTTTADEPLTKLSFHLARANPQVQYLRQRGTVLIVFKGPQAYMSPSVYPDIQRVPTWSYLAVHVRGQVHNIDAPDQKDARLKQLIHDHEAAYAQQWLSLPQTYRERMLSAIEMFDVNVIDWQCKIKLNQHRPESHQAMYAAYQNGTEQEQALAQWMAQLGLIKP